MHPNNGLSERRYCSCTSYTGFTAPNIPEKMHRSTSTDSKMFVVVVSLLEYIRKQQVVNPKRAE